MQNDITREAIEKIIDRKSKRIYFLDYPSHKAQKSAPPLFAKIKWPFKDGIEKIFKFGALLSNGNGKFEYHINSQKEYKEICSWCEERKNYIYLCNVLSLTVALGINFAEKERTEIGKLVHCLKYKNNEQAMDKLIIVIKEFINLHEIYKSADYIMAVPPTNNGYNFPANLAEKLSCIFSIPNITSDFIYKEEKKTLKDISRKDSDWFDKKWNILEQADLQYNGNNGKNKLKNKVIWLIDDNYQSGVTVQFIGMKLQQERVHEVLCLCMQKTKNDTAN